MIYLICRYFLIIIFIWFDKLCVSVHFVGTLGNARAVKHMRQDFLSVFQSFCHLPILAVQSSRKRVLAPLPLQVYVCH